MSRIATSLRGLPEWLIRRYLEDLGGVAAADGAAAVRGPGWSVSWSERSACVPGSRIRLTEFALAFEGDDPEALAALHARFMAKAQRGGG